MIWASKSPAEFKQVNWPDQEYPWSSFENSCNYGRFPNNTVYSSCISSNVIHYEETNTNRNGDNHIVFRTMKAGTKSEQTFILQ